MCPDAVTPTILFALDSFTGNVPENPKCLWGGAGLEIDVTILLKLWTFFFGGGGVEFIFSSFSSPPTF